LVEISASEKPPKKHHHVVKTVPFLPPMTGHGNHTTYQNGDDWVMVHGIVLPTIMIENC
jgi:hypothetical protein